MTNQSLTEQEFIYKTLEFKLTLSSTQQKQVDQMLEAQQHVWNIGVSLLEQFLYFNTYNKDEKVYYPCCPISWDYKWYPLGVYAEQAPQEQKTQLFEWRDPNLVASLPKNDPLRVKYVCIPYTPLWFDRDTSIYTPVIPKEYVPSQIKNDTEYGITPWFAYSTLHERTHPTGRPINVELIRSCRYKYMQGTIKILATAWMEFKKHNRKKPRYKGKRNRIKTISNNAKNNARPVGNNRLKITGFDQPILVRHFDKRWGGDRDIVSYHITKAPSGYYLYVVGKFPVKKYKPSSIKAGFNGGITHLLTDDQGKHIENPNFLLKQEKKLQRLQRKAARQRRLNNNRITQNYLKTIEKIRLLHEKIKRQRKAHAHKISTFAVRKFGAIAVDNYDLQKMSARPKPILNKQKTSYLNNGAKFKAGLNKRLLDAGLGQVYNLMEQKANSNDRLFDRVDPKFQSQTCSKCGNVHPENRLSAALFQCIACGYKINADKNAAINNKQSAFSSLTERNKLD